MDHSSTLESVAFCRGYKNAEEMLSLSTVVPSLIDDNDERTWPEFKVDRTILVQVLGGGSFAIHEGGRHNIGLGWDEMLGHLAAMTVPQVLKDRGHIYPMTTDEEDAKEIERRIARRAENQK